MRRRSWWKSGPQTLPYVGQIVICSSGPNGENYWEIGREKPPDSARVIDLVVNIPSWMRPGYRTKLQRADSEATHWGRPPLQRR